jgi:hypothetical protein
MNSWTESRRCCPKPSKPGCSSHQLRGRYTDTPGHLRVAVLQAVASLGVAPLDALVSSLGRPAGEFWSILAQFLDTGVMDVEPTEEEEPQPAFALTPDGRMLIEHWEAEESGLEESGPRRSSRQRSISSATT